MGVYGTLFFSIIFLSFSMITMHSGPYYTGALFLFTIFPSFPMITVHSYLIWCYLT